MNPSFDILQDCIWLQPIYSLSTIAFWLLKYLFWIDGDNLRVLARDFTLCRICRPQISHYGKFTVLHEIISTVLQVMNQIK